MAAPQITHVAPQNSQYFSINKKSANGAQPTRHHHPVQVKGIPGPGRLPFSIPPCAQTAATCPFDLFRRSFPFPAATKQYLSPLNSQRQPADWCGRQSIYPKIIHCPPSPSLNPRKTTYEELKGICTSDLVIPLPKQPSPCQLPVPVTKKATSKKRSTGNSKKKHGGGSDSKSSSPYGSSPYGSGKGSYPYYSSPPQSGYGQIEGTGTKKDSNELSGYWPSGGSYVPKEVRMKQQGYGYSYPYPQYPYPYGDGYPYSDDGYKERSTGPGSTKSSEETESEVCHRGAGASRSDEGLDFVFNPDNDMATELTVTIEPDEPDMLEYALDNGIMPVVCGYLPPSTDPCQCKVMDDKNEASSSSSSFKPSDYGYSGYGYGNSGYGSGGYPYSGYGYGSKSGSGSEQEPSTESSEYETVYTYATEDKIPDWKGSGSSGSGSNGKKRKGSRVSDDRSLELRQADQISSSTSGSS